MSQFIKTVGKKKWYLHRMSNSNLHFFSTKKPSKPIPMPAGYEVVVEKTGLVHLRKK